MYLYETKVLKFGNYSDQVKTNFTIVRGLDYYDGFCVETNLNFKAKNIKGKEVDIGSICSGGQYNKLISRFKGVDIPGTGVSIGVDRLLFAMMQLDRVEIDEQKPIIVCVMDKKYLQVEGHDDLVRDTKSTAIINKNRGAYLLAKQRAEAAQRQRDAIRNANREINNIKSEMHEIKSMLKTLLDKN